MTDYEAKVRETPEGVAHRIWQQIWRDPDKPDEFYERIIAAALREAHAAGRKEGMEEAAKIVESKTLSRPIEGGAFGLVDRRENQASITATLIAAELRRLAIDK